MRKLSFLVLSLIMLFTSSIKANNDVALLIKKAYIDVLGHIPTATEMDWYLVYNKNQSYEIAVNYLITNSKSKWNIPKNLAKMLLLSNEYKTQEKQQMMPEQITKNLFYVVGIELNLSFTQENYKIACIKLINNAMMCCDTESDIIDYMANALMCRSTNVEEINYLLKTMHSSPKKEEEAYYDVLQELMKFYDVKSK